MPDAKAAGPQNKQYNNVGNTGDILKHAALLELAQLISEQPGDAALNYLDTHAFVAEAPVANANWRDEAQALVERWPAYARYLALQGPYVQKGGYLCSSGLGASLLPTARLVLCEHDASTRAALRAQFARMQCGPVQILEDVSCGSLASEAEAAGSLLALVDPFMLSERDWAGACCAVARLWRPGADGLLVVFTFDREATAVNWPAAPDGWEGPVAQIGRAPYFLALYATGDIAAAAVARLVALGWCAL